MQQFVQEWFDEQLEQIHFAQVYMQEWDLYF